MAKIDIYKANLPKNDIYKGKMNKKGQKGPYFSLYIYKGKMKRPMY